ncbi:MAG: hypothetical protein ABWW69_00790 [Pyrodictiaceae archaeon]
MESGTSLSTRLAELIDKAMKESIDPLTMTEKVEEAYSSLLDYKLIKKARWLVKGQFKIIEEVAELVAEQALCPEEFKAKAKEFWKKLAAGRIIIVKPKKCILVTMESNTITIQCLEPFKALLKFILGEAKPLTVKPI